MTGNDIEAAPVVDGAASSGDTVARLISQAAQLPGVHVSRERYLSAALRRHCTEEQIRLAITSGPAAAGIPPTVLESLAKSAIRYETTKVTGLSTVAGIPGGIALAGTIPADTAQYFAHMIRIAQKLAYLYGWPDLFTTDGENLDDATRNVLMLFIGVMFGASAANGAVTKAATMIAAQASRKLPQQALTKGVIYPIVKKVATQLGAKMTKQVFATGVSKFVPVLGGIVSGGVTLATFLPMAIRLKSHLATTPLAVEGDEGGSAE